MNFQIEGKNKISKFNKATADLYKNKVLNISVLCSFEQVRICNNCVKTCLVLST